MALSETKKAILQILDDLQNLSGDRQENIAKLKQTDKNLLAKIAEHLLTDINSAKRMQGIKGLMLIDEENNVGLILPSLNDADFEVRWTAMYYITRSKKFLEDNNIINRIIILLLEDSRPEIRVEAAEMLRYCKTTPDVISALEHARVHDYVYDANGYSAGDVATDSLEWIKSNSHLT